MPGFWKGVSLEGSLYFLIYVYGIQKWQKDTFLMKNSKVNQWLYFLSFFLLLSHPFSSIPAFVPLFSLPTSSIFKNFLLSFSLFMILLCLCILFTHLPRTASSILCGLHTYRGPATCDSTAECPPCFMAWHWWYHFTLSMIYIFNFFLIVFCTFKSCPLAFCSLPTHPL